RHDRAFLIGSRGHSLYAPPRAGSIQKRQLSILGYRTAAAQCKLATMDSLFVRRPAAAVFTLILSAAAFARGSATGTVVIAHPDGSTKSYANVRIAIWNESMAITSSDGQGTVVFGKASCTKVGELVQCIPW